MLGIYEMMRIELLRDLYIWAYERSTQEYLAIKKNLTEPDPLRLLFREEIKQIVHEVVIQTEQDPLDIIRRALQSRVDGNDLENVEALIIEELRTLH